MLSRMKCRIIRPYSPSKWYDCYRYRIQYGMNDSNEYYNTLTFIEKERMHLWLSKCFTKMDLILLDHDNHSFQMEWGLPYEYDTNNNDNNNNNKNDKIFDYDKKFKEILGYTPITNPDYITLTAKHDIPKGLTLFKEMPIGYVNFKKYYDKIKNIPEIHDKLMNEEESELSIILNEINSVNYDKDMFEGYLHPKQSVFTPKYDMVYGYDHPIWEIVHSIVDYLKRMCIYYHNEIEPFPLKKKDIQISNIDSDEIIHYQFLQAFIWRYIHIFRDNECPNPIPNISENPPQSLIDSYKYLPPIFFSNIFRLIHLNAYINQTLFQGIILGHGLFGISSYMDHSCDPNVMYCTYNGYLHMITIKDIKKGEKLTTSYLAGYIDTIDTWERRNRLKSFGFNCQCSRCLQELAYLDAINVRESDNYNKSLNILKNPGDDTYIMPQRQMKEYPITIWTEYKILHNFLSESLNEMSSKRLYQYTCFNDKNIMAKRHLKSPIKRNLVVPLNDAFQTLDVLYPDAAFGDIICNTAIKKI